MEKITQTFTTTFRQFHFSSPCNVLVSVSGGADSMVLLSLFQTTTSLLKTNLFAIHMNHHLRGTDSDQDQNLVERYCESLSIPLTVVHFTPEMWNRTTGSGVEEKARKLRRNSILQWHQKNSAHVTAIGHNQGDLTETFLFNLIRGSSPEKLSDVLPIWDLHSHIFRPLLYNTREEIREFAERNSIPFRDDKTNTDTQFSRNRIREKIIPEMLRINPSFSSSILRFQDILSHENEILETILSEVLRTCHIETNQFRFSLQLFKEKPVAIQRRLLLYARNYVTGNRIDFSFSAIEEIRKSLFSQQLKNGILYKDHFITLQYNKPFITIKKRGNET